MYDNYVKIISALFTFIIVFVLTASVASADYRQEILGASNTHIDFPSVTAGPGYILPDSPFYFIDLFKQQIKLATAIGPRSRSITHIQIAGERLAEVRAMVERNNEAGIQKALSGLSSEIKFATNDLEDAAGQGKDVEKLAKMLTSVIKDQRSILAKVEAQTAGPLALQLLATSESLRFSKFSVEHYLPAPDQEHEMTANIFEQMDRAVLGASTTAEGIRVAAQELTKQASVSAQKTLDEKNQLLQNAVASGNKDEVKKAQDALVLETAKQKAATGTVKIAIDAAVKASSDAEKSAALYESAKASFQGFK